MRTPVELLVHNTSELLTARSRSDAAVRGADLESIEVIPDGALAVAEGRIVAVGPSADLREQFAPVETVDAERRLVSPAFSDPHTHLLHGGSRHDEWLSKVLERPTNGIDGGIRSTLAATAAATDDELLDHANLILDDMLADGITAIEAKSGYGLSRESELRLLRLSTGITHPVSIESTYLGAHTVPERFANDREGYIAELLDDLAEARRLTDVCDIAIDPVSFTAEEGDRLARAAEDHGFRLRFHADQTADGGGTAVAVAHDALTVDHLDFVSDEGLAALAASPTVGVIFPTANLHLLDTTPGRHGKQPRNLVAWADRLFASGAALALSTDYNPGTSPSASMQLTMQLAARLYRRSFATVWNLATVNAAYALGRGSERGSIASGKRADFIIWNAREHGQVVHRLGSNLASEVYSNGRLVARDGSRVAR